MKRTDTFMGNGSRYTFNMGECSQGKGFAQLDTGQDAPYFGQWANAEKLTYVSYVEGDVTRITFDNKGEFVKYIRQTAAFYKKLGYGFSIDGMCNENIISRFTELGLGDLLY